MTATGRGDGVKKVKKCGHSVLSKRSKEGGEGGIGPKIAVLLNVWPLTNNANKK